jgi:hypothetical protein
VFDSVHNRVYFVPYAQTGALYWHYIQEYVSTIVPPAVTSLPMFNKY